jgi:outer membrane receptor protein involved in Fe transport
VRPLTVASAVSAILSGAAGAQTPPATESVGPQLEEVIVTAQKRTENLQDVPVSIQALDTRKLEQLQVTSFDDYLKFLPSLSSQTLGPGQEQLYVRGVTNGGDGLQVGSQPLVGVYLDEQPVTTIANNLDVHIYDIARVEQLSGPQGTLFGSSSMAGTVRIITNKPSTKGFEAGYSLTADNLRSRMGGTAEGFVNIPISDRAAIRLVGFAERDAGYINNVLVDKKADGSPLTYPTSGALRTNAGLTESNYNNTDTYGARAALKIDLDSNWTVTPSAMAQQQKSHGQFSYSPALGDLNVARYSPERFNDRWWQAALTVEGKIANFDLLYAGGYLHRTTDLTNDYSDYSYFYDAYYHNQYAGTRCPVPDPQYPNYYCETAFGDNFRNDAGDLINPAQTTVSHQLFTKQSHELRLSSPTDRRFRMVAGLFFQRQTNVPRDEYRIKGLAAIYSITGEPGVLYLNAQNRVDKDFAAFTELSYDLTPRLSLTGGLRWFKFDNAVTGFFGYNGKPTYDGWTHASGEQLCDGPSDPNNPVRPCNNILDPPVSDHGETYKANVTYKFTDERMLYATWSTGFRPGGVNRVRTRVSYTPDYLRNVEVGWKTAWLDGRVRFNGALFDENWKDPQFAITGENGITEIVNSGRARIRGVESDVQWAATHNLMLSVSATWLDAKLTRNACKYPSPTYTCTERNVVDGADNVVIAATGARLPVSPRLKANMVARYKFSLGDLDAHVQAALVTQTNALALLDFPSKQPAYTSLDLATGVEHGNWAVEFHVGNVLDRRGEASRFTTCNASVCTPIYVVPIRPRNIGLVFSQKF